MFKKVLQRAQFHTSISILFFFVIFFLCLFFGKLEKLKIKETKKKIVMMNVPLV